MANGGPNLSADRRPPAREFRTAPIVRGRLLLLLYLLFGWIPVMCVREALLTDQPVDEIVQLLSVAAMAVFLLGWLTYSWAEHRRYGESVCRLLSIPVVPGGRLEADIECSLPLASDAPIVVRLRNQVPRGKVLELHWQAESQLDPATITAHGAGRVVVPVRLRIPASPGPRPTGASPAGYGPRWVLELSRTAPGMDFHAEFVIPVADGADEPHDAPRGG